jgi:hypothetical protein
VPGPAHQALPDVAGVDFPVRVFPLHPPGPAAKAAYVILHEQSMRREHAVSQETDAFGDREDGILGRVQAEAVAEEEMSFETTDQEATLKQQVANLVRAYLEQVPPDEPRPAAVEANLESNLVDPLTGEDLGIPLLGFIDLILGTDDGPVIIDFKTSARSAPPFEITHEIQLSAYAWLYRQVTGSRESGLQIRSLIKTKQPKIETHRYPARTDAHFRRLFAVIREYLDALHAGRFNFRPGWGCGMCDFRSSQCSTWAG